jgi:hypothetical protein
MRNREVWALSRVEQNSLAAPPRLQAGTSAGKFRGRWRFSWLLESAYFFIALPSITGVHFVPSCDTS